MTEFLTVTVGAEDGEEFIPGNVGRIASGCELKICDLTTGEALGPNIRWRDMCSGK